MKNVIEIETAIDEIKGISDVMNLIDENYYKMSNIELFKKEVGENGIASIKKYVEYITAESVYKNYTEALYIKAFLTNMLLMYICNDDVLRASTYVELLLENFTY